MKDMNATLIDGTREAIIAQKRSVMALFTIDDLDYGSFQFNMGLKLLNDHLIDNEVIKTMSENKNYWNWFKMQYVDCEKEVMIVIIEMQEYDFREYQLQIDKAFNNPKVHLSFHQFLSIFKFIR